LANANLDKVGHVLMDADGHHNEKSQSHIKMQIPDFTPLEEFSFCFNLMQVAGIVFMQEMLAMSKSSSFEVIIKSSSITLYKLILNLKVACLIYLFLTQMRWIALAIFGNK